MVVVPNEIVEKLGWVGNQELTAEARGRVLILKPA